MEKKSPSSNERVYVIQLRDGKRHSFKQYRYFKDAVYGYSDDQIQYLAIRTGDDMEQVKALSVFNVRLNEQIRTRVEALEQLVGGQVQELLSRPAPIPQAKNEKAVV